MPILSLIQMYGIEKKEKKKDLKHGSEITEKSDFSPLLHFSNEHS